MNKAGAFVSFIAATGAAACTGGTRDSYGTAQQELGAPDWSHARALVPAQDGTEGPVEPLVPDDWVGYELGTSPGKWRYIGDTKLSELGTRLEPPPVESALAALSNALRPQPVAPRPDRGTVVVANTKTRQIYEVQLAEAEGVVTSVAAAHQAVKWRSE